MLEAVFLEIIFTKNYFFSLVGVAAGFSSACFLQQAASFFLQHAALPVDFVQAFAHSFLSPAITVEAAKNKANDDNKNTFFIFTKILDRKAKCKNSIKQFLLTPFYFL